MKTIDEVMQENFGDKTDIFSYNVYKTDWGTHNYFTYLLTIESNSIIHLFKGVGVFSDVKHLKFKSEYIKKISVGYNLYLYLLFSTILCTMLNVLTCKTLFLYFNIDITASLVIGLIFPLYLLSFFILTKIFFARKIKIKTTFHTSYSFFYPEFPTTHNSFSAINAKEFEKNILSLKSLSN